MNKLEIAGTVNSPTVSLDADKGLLELSGRSIPETAYEFFTPLIDWVKAYAKAPKAETTLNMRLEYINSNSFKMILDILKPLEQLHLAGKKVFINWYYEKDDEAMLEAAEDYREVLKIPINVVAVDEF